MKISPGSIVILTECSFGLLANLPDDDQAAIQAMVDKSVVLAGYDEHGRAELEFVDAAGDRHTIWVAPSCIQTA
jgi:hypothetical protein